MAGFEPGSSAFCATITCLSTYKNSIETLPNLFNRQGHLFFHQVPGFCLTIFERLTGGLGWTLQKMPRSCPGGITDIRYLESRQSRFSLVCNTTNDLNWSSLEDNMRNWFSHKNDFSITNTQPLTTRADPVLHLFPPKSYIDQPISTNIRPLLEFEHANISSVTNVKGCIYY